MDFTVSFGCTNPRHADEVARYIQDVAKRDGRADNVRCTAPMVQYDTDEPTDTLSDIVPQYPLEVFRWVSIMANT